jgi:hypothetical protein
MRAAIGEFAATIRTADSFVSDYTVQTTFFGWPRRRGSVIGEMHLLRGRMHLKHCVGDAFMLADLRVFIVAAAPAFQLRNLRPRLDPAGLN